MLLHGCVLIVTYYLLKGLVIIHHAFLETYPYSPRLVRVTSHETCFRVWTRCRQQAPSSAGCLAGLVASVSKITLAIRRHSRRHRCLEGVQHERLLFHTPASRRRLETRAQTRPG